MSSDSQWVRIPVGRNNWLRFDALTDDEMAEVVKRLDSEYGQSDIAGKYAYAWLDVARLISTLAAVQSLVALQTSPPASHQERDES